mgnify:CR=1 FL=1
MKKPHYKPVQWLTLPRGAMELAAAMAASRVEGEIRRGRDWASADAVELNGLAVVDTKFGRVVFKPGELPIWISTPAG